MEANKAKQDNAQPKWKWVNSKGTSYKWHYSISNDGDVFVFNNLADFCRERGLSKNCMSNVANPRYPNKQHKGWKVFKEKNFG